MSAFEKIHKALVESAAILGTGMSSGKVHADSQLKEPRPQESNNRKYSVAFTLMMEPLQTKKVIKDSPKTRICVVYNERTEEIQILRICKNRDLSSVCEKIKEIKSPNAAVIYDYVYEDGDTYILEEYISGESLSDIIEHKGTMSEAETTKIILDVCNALEVFHKQNPPVVHNDINPSNIMIREDGTVKLFDFDISRTYKKGQNQNTTLFGTDEYASPEHFGYGQSDPKTDIYCLGVTMHKMLTGEVLSSDHEITYTGKLRNVIEKCVKVDSKKRYTSVIKLRRDLERFLSAKKRAFYLPILILIALAMVVGFTTVYFDFSNKKAQEGHPPISKDSTFVVVSEKNIESEDEDKKFLDIHGSEQNSEKSLVENLPKEEQQSSTNDVFTENKSENTYISKEGVSPTTSFDEEQKESDTEETSENSDKTEDSHETEHENTRDTIKINVNQQYSVENPITEDKHEGYACYEFTTDDISNEYRIAVSFSYPSYLLIMKNVGIYDMNGNLIFGDESTGTDFDFSVNLEKNTKYLLWISEGISVSYDFSITSMTPKSASGTSREKALPLELNTSYINIITDISKSDWYKITTSNNHSAYRFYINHPTQYGLDYMFLNIYDKDGIKINTIRADYEGPAFWDTMLDPNEDYALKVYTSEYGGGEYQLCVYEKTCDTGTDINSSTEITLNNRVSGVLNSTLPDWYVFKAPETGNFKITCHNIDVGCDISFSGECNNCIIFYDTIVKNEDNGSAKFIANQGDIVYLKIKTLDMEADGQYILTIESYTKS